MLLLASETSKTPFYVAAALLVAWAIGLFVVGMRAEGDWPANESSARLLMVVSGLLVATTMAAAVLTG
jgi:hypothetical protein